MQIPHFLSLSLLLFLANCILPWQSVAREQFEFTTFEQIDHFFAAKGYTRTAWEKGLSVIPPFFLTRIPDGHHEHYAREIPVIEKKELFFRLLAPEILLVNQRIEGERKILETLEKAEDRLRDIAIKYKVIHKDAQLVEEREIEELRLRVDTIPLSMALAQAADESGWGTSRFAREGNALFGQWTWSGEGLKSRNHQSGKGQYRVASFASPVDSISAYMLNLNTHPQYAPLREARAALRKKGRTPTGIELSAFLTAYSQKGEAYVRDIRAMISTNKLERLDTAALAPSEPVYLNPVAANSKQ